MAENQPVPYTAQHVYDALPSPPDARDYRMMVIDLASLPETVLLPDVPVLNQSNEGACVGHGVAGARETLEVNIEGVAPTVPLSRAMIYYLARAMEGTQNQDSGAFVRDGCKVVAETGVCTESDFPYTAGDYATPPPPAAIAAAARYKIDSYARLNSTPEVRAALANGSPVVIGIAVYQSFETSVGPDGRVPIPDPTREQLLGGHCVFIRGYHPDPITPGAYLFDAQNSWGPGWADGGHMHFPQAYIDNPNLTTDIWSVTLNKKPPPPVPPPNPTPQPHRRRRWHFFPF